MSLTLNKSQAQAIFDAMCAMNNVDGKIKVLITENEKTIIVSEQLNGSILVTVFNNNTYPCASEKYASQVDFAEAYSVS